MNTGTDSEYLPKGWTTVPLQAVVTKLVDGSHNPPSKQEVGRPMLSARNIANNQIVFDEYRFISEENFARQHARTRVSPGDVLLTMVGTIGRSAVVPVGSDGFALQRSVAVMTPMGVLPKYLMYQFQAPFLQRHFEKNARGTAQKGVYLKTLGQTPIVVAPLSQQELIVAEIEKQFSRLDEGIVNLKRVEANLKRYKAAVLKAAVEGELTEEWRKQHPNVEPASKLLERILAERLTKWKGRGKYKEPVGPETSNLPLLPKGWDWASLEQLSWDSSYGTSVKCGYDNSGPRVLRIPNIESGKLDFGDLKCAPGSFQIEQGEELSVGDVLIIRTNGSRSLIGRSAVVKQPLLSRSTYASYLIRFRLVQQSEVIAWVSTIWDSDLFRQWIEQRAATSAGQHNISMTVLATLPIPLPPLVEHQRIVAEVDRRLSVIEELEAAVLANLRRADLLRQSVLRQAFEGNLIQ